MATPEVRPPLNYWYLVDPKEESLRNARWNIVFKTAAIITFIAATALVSSVVVFSFLTAGGAAIPSSLSITVAVAAMMGGPLTHRASALWNKSKPYLAEEKKEQRVEDWRAFLSKLYLKNGETLDIENIKKDTLFQHFGISVTQDTLTQIEQELPKDKKELKAGQAWIRVAARFMRELEITRVPDPEALESSPLKTLPQLLTEFYQRYLNELWNKSKKYLIEEKKEQRTEEWRDFLSKIYLNHKTLNIEKINQDGLFQHLGISVTKEILIKIKQELPQDKKELTASEAWIGIAAGFMYELETTQNSDAESSELVSLKSSPEILTKFCQKYLKEFCQKYLSEITQKSDLKDLPLKTFPELFIEFYQNNLSESDQKKLREFYQNHLNEFYQKRSESYQREYTYRQMHIYQRSLNTVLFLAIMKQPFLKAARLTDLGFLHIKPYIARQNDFILEGQDPYFTSNKENSKPIRTYKGPLAPVANELISLGMAYTPPPLASEFKSKLQRLTELLLGNVLHNRHATP
jgi:hypothetical protein